MGGRPRKPTIIKMLGGEKRKNRLNPNEPHPPISVPKCPESLDVMAQAEYARLAPILAEMGLMSEIYRNMLAQYCQAWSDWNQAQRLSNKKGMLTKSKAGNVNVSPLIRIKREAFDTMYRTAREFGFSPAAMSKLTVPKQNEPAKNKWSNLG
jgi:P27 family predicted phage terminase small subunit